TLADTPRQNASALARVIGSMKLTDAPPSTQSISTSLSPAMSRSSMVSSGRIRMAPDTFGSSTRTRLDCLPRILDACYERGGGRFCGEDPHTCRPARHAHDARELRRASDHRVRAVRATLPAGA